MTVLSVVPVNDGSIFVAKVSSDKDGQRIHRLEFDELDWNNCTVHDLPSGELSRATE
jgi:hypothetical protein